MAYQAIVLAGERENSNPLAQRLGVAAGVLVPVAGKTCIDRVLDSLSASACIDAIKVCGPAAKVLDAHPDLQQRITTAADTSWLAPMQGPAASALSAAVLLDEWPILLTSGDHALLQAPTIDKFYDDVTHKIHTADVIVGLVPYTRVSAAYPDTQRTLLRFSDGVFCGSNLFALITPEAKHVLEFWQTLESLRKQPWKIAARLGLLTLIRYLSRRLSVNQAMARLSDLAGCRISWVSVDDPRAAVDVDSYADWLLAQKVLSTAQEQANARVTP